MCKKIAIRLFSLSVVCALLLTSYGIPKKYTIRGLTSNDISVVQNDIQAIFKSEKFLKFRDLIRVDFNGINLMKITDTALKTTLNGIQLDSDEVALIEIVKNTINSDKIHLIEYVKDDAVISDQGQKILVKEFDIYSTGGADDIQQAIYLKIDNMGGAATVRTDSGSYSIILLDKNYTRRRKSDYINLLTKRRTRNPVGRVSITGHEIFGHGRPFSLGRGDAFANADGIRTENLILRVMGYYNIQRDGSNHNKLSPERKKLPEPSRLPDFWKIGSSIPY